MTPTGVGAGVGVVVLVTEAVRMVGADTLGSRAEVSTWPADGPDVAAARRIELECTMATVAPAAKRPARIPKAMMDRDVSRGRFMPMAKLTPTLVRPARIRCPSA